MAVSLQQSGLSTRTVHGPGSGECIGYVVAPRWSGIATGLPPRPSGVAMRRPFPAHPPAAAPETTDTETSAANAVQQANGRIRNSERMAASLRRQMNMHSPRARHQHWVCPPMRSHTASQLKAQYVAGSQPPNGEQYTGSQDVRSVPSSQHVKGMQSARTVDEARRATTMMPV